MKLNVLLAKTDTLAPYYKNLLNDISKFFGSKQGAFQGEQRTYTPKEGTVDEPNRRGNNMVQTTVTEKFEWMKESAADYLNALFSQEKTNASGTATAELVVDGESWGVLTSLELLRLKSIVENNNMFSLLSNIPVRSDSESWLENTAEMYGSREVYMSPVVKGTNKTTEKESYILLDPNVKPDSAGYKPQIAQKTTTVELGDYTIQKFSGEWSQRQKAEALRRRTILLTSIVEALKECNEVEVQESSLTSDRIFSYLLGS